jgi:hypothetical protein
LGPIQLSNGKEEQSGERNDENSFLFVFATSPFVGESSRGLWQFSLHLLWNGLGLPHQEAQIPNEEVDEATIVVRDVGTKLPTANDMPGRAVLLI